ncbi:hypothetical protein C6P40_002854 [Pichia californica]|uniref:Uncharacterized protein n=1 Tax=Pichia californica TaxID=460514 RepID=A0A9P6WH82_9ASCO|nr:hypothetical protein C6P40_002854 [[Candida] californica]
MDTVSIYPILIGCSIVTLFISFFILYKLTNIKLISIPLNLTLIISLFLPLSTTYLLPIDLTIPLNSNTSNIISIIWKLNYWITFFSTWLILPFWQYYLSSGKFKIIDKIKQSFWLLLKYLIILIIISILFLIYVIIYHYNLLNFKFIKSLLITTSHIYSLTMAIWLMANGLIYLPNYFWITSYSKKLNNLYLKLPNFQIQLEDSKFELKDICNKIISLNKLINLNPNILINWDDISIRDNILNLFNKIPNDFKIENNINNNYQFLLDNIDLPINEINNNYLSKLNEDLKWKIWDYQHSKSIFENKIYEIVYFEDIINYINNNSTDNNNNNNLLEIEWRNFKIRWPKFIFIYFIPISSKILSILLYLIGLIIIESEILHGTKFSILSLLINNLNFLNCLKMIQILILMMSYSIISLSMIKLFNIYKIEFNSNSDPVSSIFFISYSLRLTIPINYNFLMLLNKNLTENSEFLKFVNDNLELIKIGEFLNDIIPRLILIPLLMSFFGIWGKLRRFLDGYFLFDYILDEMDFNDDENMISNNRDIESIIGSTNKTAALLREGKSISQRYIMNGSIQLNDSINTSSLLQLQNNSKFNLINLLLPFKIIGLIGINISNKIINLFNNNNHNNNDNNYNTFDLDNSNGLRSYNLNSNIVLESRRNSDISEQSGLSGVSGISRESGTEYDVDNRVLGDEYIRNIQ